MAKDLEKKAESKSGPARATTPWAQMERWMDEFMPGHWMQRWGGPAFGDLWAGMPTQTPSVDVIDRDDAIVVKAEIPGVRKDDIEISVTDHSLRLAGKSRQEETEETDNFFRREIRHGEFSRIITLPSSVDTDNTSARFDDGVLTVSMPKLTRTSRKRVEIA